MRLAASVALVGAAPLFACRAPVTSVGEWSRDSGLITAAPHDAAADALRAPTGQYLEAEDGVLSGGFTVGESTVASGGRYIGAPAGATSIDTPGAARAVYSVSVDRPATYVIWGRVHSPDPLHNALWIQVDGGTWHLWRISTGDVFFWDAFHDGVTYGLALTFAFETGSHQLVVANAVEQVELDRLYFTADGDVPPGNDTLCHPPDSIEVNGVCQLSCGSQGGTTCGADVCQGYVAIPAYDCAVCCTVP